LHLPEHPQQKTCSHSHPRTRQHPLTPAEEQMSCTCSSEWSTELQQHNPNLLQVLKVHFRQD
jgi:predicted nucleic acid-binding Zn ribbon protein